MCPPSTLRNENDEPVPVGRAAREALSSLANGNDICRVCGGGYKGRLPKSGVCEYCQGQARLTAGRRADLQRWSGIDIRHGALREWDELEGPAAYRQAIKVVRAFVEHSDSVLGLIGPRGTGKTQMAAVAVWQTIERDFPARLTTARKLLSDLRARYGEPGDDEGEWLEQWSRPRLLAIDEITESPGSDHAQQMLSALIDERYQMCQPTLLLGNVIADRFGECVGESIASRCCEGGGLVDFSVWSSFRGMT